MRGKLSVLFLILFWPTLVFSKNEVLLIPSYDISSFRAEIKIEKNGEVKVTKTFLLSSPSSDFSWFEDPPISNVSVFVGDLQLNKNHYQVIKEKGKIFIKAKTETPTQDWTIKYKAPASVKPSTKFPSRDSFFSCLVSEPGVYINDLRATLILPGPFRSDEVKQKVYAIHGVEASGFYALDAQTLIYQGNNLSPFATYTIEASWPAGLIQYAFFKKLSFILESLNFKFWLSAGIILPVLAFVFFFIMLIKKKKEEKIESLSYLNKPPMELAPALVGILCRERAAQREITATILDLAQRGFIDIVKKREEYVLGKRRGRGELLPFEALLYEKLFTQGGERKIKRTEFELEKRAAEQLYSPKVSQFYQYLYEEIQKRGYFVKNPILVALRYRIFGIIFFLLAIFASFLSVRYSSGPPYILFGFLGQIIASFLIIKTAPLMSKKTAAGRIALAAWLSFGRFLSDKKPIDLLNSQQGLFEKYLPYAVALGKEIEWVLRFANLPYIPPAWYVADETVTLENFAASLFFITGSLSQLLYNLREPGL